jgi:hypothetical protein
MSGEFREEQNVTIASTDDPELAKRHGLTQFDKATGQYTAPKAPDAGQRDGSGEQYRDALALAGEQHEAERKRLEAEIESLRADAASRDPKATKATGTRAKDSDGK